MVALVGLAVSGSNAAARPQPARILFDDFSYATPQQLAAHWIARTEPGWPGIRGGRWSADNVSLDHGVLRLTSSTDGTAAGTSETQVCHERKYLAGTYATRVRFRDTPSVGPDGDTIVETFYAISPLQAPLDPEYGELDFEYLPNGGWDTAAPTLYVTSWETASIDPWIPVNAHTSTVASLDGWHVLVVQVGQGKVRFFVDGRLRATDREPYYPKVPMSINYNLWFSGFGSVQAGPLRRYEEDVDWVFHRAGAPLSPAQVASEVATLRRGGVRYRDTVPPDDPPLESPCNF